MSLSARQPRKALRLTTAATLIGCGPDTALKILRDRGISLFKLRPEKANSPWMCWERDVLRLVEQREETR